MRVLISLLFAFVFLFSSEIKIATFNVENLFDGTTQGTEYKEFRGKNWSNAKYQRKLSQIASLLKEMDADIVGLQEIENRAVLENLAKVSGYKYSYFSKSKSSPIGVGIISKLPFAKTSTYRPRGVITRDIIKADFEYEGAKFSVYNTHFLAATNEFKDRKRNARELERFTQNAKNAVVLGDFNTEYGARSLLNDMIKNNGFVDLWSEYTLKKSSHKSGRAIDHILLSKDLLKNGALKYKSKSFKVYANHKSISDHYPLVFTLTLDEQIKDVKIKPNSINEFYGKTELEFPFILKDVVVTFKDKNGFALADKSKRGVYVFDRENSLKEGEIVDIKVFGVGFYQENFQIDDFEILSKKGTTRVENYTLNQKELMSARHGDVIGSISGAVKDGYFDTKFGKIRIHSFERKLNNINYTTFQNAFFTVYKGEKELIVK
ncbi:MAG: endonuclease/exonuclease/phosphatase family protein [Campylobacteraceae bacterium]|nr:endonuclease/exonuclease/phosphatase family protein [Campylobacteraceae bacterium]